MSFLNFLPVIGPAVSGLIGGIFNSASQNSANQANLQAVRETNQANRELAQYNWEQQVKMWHDNNAYNSPSAQMNRFREAGLNPHLIYGQGSNGNSTSTPTPQLPTMEAPRVESLRYGDAFQGIGDSVAAYFNLRKLKNETDLAESQVVAQSVENRLKLAQMITEFSKNRGLEIDNSTKSQLQQYLVKGAAQDLISKTNENNLFETKVLRAEIELQIARNNEWMSRAQIESVFKSMDVMSAKIAEAYSSASLNSVKRKQVNEIIRGLGLENDMKFATFDAQKQMVLENLSRLITNRKINEADLKRILVTGHPTGEIGGIVNALYTFGLNLGF